MVDDKNKSDGVCPSLVPVAVRKISGQEPLEAKKVCLAYRFPSTSHQSQDRSWERDHLMLFPGLLLTAALPG